VAHNHRLSLLPPKYQKNPVEYFKYEIERMSREANDVLKKLGKLYALAKDDV
jgi:hypothetical protein